MNMTKEMQFNKEKAYTDHMSMKNKCFLLYTATMTSFQSSINTAMNVLKSEENITDEDFNELKEMLKGSDILGLFDPSEIVINPDPVVNSCVKTIKSINKEMSTNPHSCKDLENPTSKLTQLVDNNCEFSDADGFLPSIISFGTCVTSAMNAVVDHQDLQNCPYKSKKKFLKNVGKKSVNMENFIQKQFESLDELL